MTAADAAIGRTPLPGTRCDSPALQNTNIPSPSKTPRRTAERSRTQGGGALRLLPVANRPMHRAALAVLPDVKTIGTARADTRSRRQATQIRLRLQRR